MPRKTIADIRADGALADGVQVQSVEQDVHLCHSAWRRYPFLEPGRQMFSHKPILQQFRGHGLDGGVENSRKMTDQCVRHVSYRYVF